MPLSGAGRSGALFVVGSGVFADIPAEWSEIVSGPVGRLLVGDGGQGVVVAVHESTDRNHSEERSGFFIGEVPADVGMVIGADAAWDRTGGDSETEGGSFSVTQFLGGVE